MFKKLTKEDFLNSGLEITGSTMYTLEVAATDENAHGRRSEIKIADIQVLIRKMYLQYEDPEAKWFLENLSK